MADYDNIPQWDDEEDDEQDPKQPVALGGTQGALPAWQGPPAPSGSDQPGIQRRSSRVEALGAPPTMPKPKLWQRLAAGGIGALAGGMNVSAGYPGGIKRPIDPSAAIQGITGQTGFGRNMANWQQRAKLAEYQDSLDEKAREADIRDREAQSRIQLNQSSLDVNKAYRQQIADARAEDARTRTERERTAWSQNHLITIPNYTSVNPNPIEQDSVQASDVPGADPTDHPDISSLPLRKGPVGFVNSQLPPTPITPGGYQLTPMPKWAQELNGPGSEAYAPTTPEMAAQKAQDRLQDVPEALQPMLGLKAPASEINKAMGTFMAPQKPVKPPTQNPNEWYSEMNDPDPAVSGPAKLKHDLWLKDQKDLRSVSNVTINPTSFTPRQNDIFNMQPGQERIQAVLSSLPPIKQLKVRQLLDGNAPITPTMLTPRKGQDNSWAEAANLSMLADPEWNQNTFHIRQQNSTDYNPGGKVGKNLVSLNTLSQHLDELFGAMRRLRNGDTTSLNWFKNTLGMQFGDSAYTDAKLANVAVDAELATALKGNATDTEIKQWAAGISPNMNDAQQNGAKQRLAEIMYKRMDAQLTPYVSMFHKMPMTGPTPATLQFLQSAGLDPSKLGTGLGSGAGATIHFTSPKNPAGWNIPAAQADAFQADHKDAKRSQ